MSVSKLWEGRGGWERQLHEPDMWITIGSIHTTHSAAVCHQTLALLLFLCRRLTSARLLFFLLPNTHMQNGTHTPSACVYQCIFMHPSFSFSFSLPPLPEIFHFLPKTFPLQLIKRYHRDRVTFFPQYFLIASVKTFLLTGYTHTCTHAHTQICTTYPKGNMERGEEEKNF